MVLQFRPKTSDNIQYVFKACAFTSLLGLQFNVFYSFPNKILAKIIEKNEIVYNTKHEIRDICYIY